MILKFRGGLSRNAPTALKRKLHFSNRLCIYFLFCIQTPQFFKINITLTVVIAHDAILCRLCIHCKYD